MYRLPICRKMFGKRRTYSVQLRMPLCRKIGNFRESPHFGKGVGLLYKTQEME